MDDATADQQAQATERVAILATLARPVQHEINNLLTVVFANLEMLRRAASEGAPRRQLERVEEAARRLDATSRAILSLTRRPPGGEPAEVSLTEAVTALRPLFLMLLPGAGALSLDLDPGGWKVRLDRALLDEALLRLALDVAKATPRGPALGLLVANRPGGMAGGDAAELLIRRHTPGGFPEAREPLQRLAVLCGGELADAEGGEALRLVLPRLPDSPAPGARLGSSAIRS
jgi:signal transduction histidine kinase